MFNAQLLKRIENLEREVAGLKRSQTPLVSGNAPVQPSWRDMIGHFAGDPHFKKAMKIGAAYRKNYKPASRKKTSK